MSRSFGLVDCKVQEAEYFLGRIQEAECGFFGVQHDAVAFPSSARSITFAMQSSLKGIPEFDLWYRDRQEELRQNHLARFFHEFRRVSQHIGTNLVSGGRSDPSGEVYYFLPDPELTLVPDLDVAASCVEYFKMTLNLVYDCYVSFNPIINGQWYFTRENFAAHGKTLQDAYVEMGLPIGWGEGSGLHEDVIWRLLRREADGCNLQHQFERWLRKRLPHPDDEV